MPTTETIADPLARFQTLMDDAAAAGVELANAVSLCTVTDGRPWARTVLVKGISGRGVRFFTNHESNKGRALLAGSEAAMCVYWHATLMQVQLAGPVAAIPAADSDAYFASRARGSRVGAWASDQSRPIESRAALLDKVAAAEARFEGVEDVPRPPHWGGFEIVPHTLELWHDGEHRIHHRERFTRQTPESLWELTLLQP